MEKNKKFLADISKIKEAIETKKLVVFAGAGISIDAGVPSWSKLIEEISSEIDIPKTEQDYLKIAQMYFNERQQKEYVEKIRKVLLHKKVKYNEIHEAIFQLAPEHVLTTNYDDLLEQAIRKLTLPFSVITKDSQFPYALNTNLLIKVHGDLDDTDFVLKEDDYIDYSENHPLIEAFVKGAFASKVVLFVGYSFSDINLKMIIQNVRNILGKDFQNAYLLATDDGFHHSQREYLKSKGINVLNYSDAEIQEDKNYIDEYLAGQNSLNQSFYKKGDNLSSMGQRLLNFLIFISKYDKFNETLSTKNVIDQIYLSLNRFEELDSLPPEFVVNLFPFSHSTNNYQSLDGYSLLINPALNSLFFDQLNYSDKEITFNAPPELHLSSKVSLEYNRKVKKIMTKLKLSLIYFLHKANEKPDYLGYKGFSSDYKSILTNTNETCNCINCKIDRCTINEVLGRVSTTTISDTTSIQDDLELAYAHYKVGNFKQSFYLYEEIANKAWQMGKFFSYYIAKRNIKTITNLLNFYDTEIDRKKRATILQIAYDIDFDKLLFQVPYLGKSQYELLKIIRDDDVLKRSEQIINDSYSRIFEIHEGYKNSSTQVYGQNFALIILYELKRIINFYTKNFIVIDEFSNFTRVCQKAIEACFISYATSTEYKYRLTVFDEFFFTTFVQYCTASTTKKITDKYEIEAIIFDEKSLGEILESTNNFLKSFWEKNGYAPKGSEANKLINTQISNPFFSEKCHKQFTNIFFLLSGVSIKHENKTEIFNNIFQFLEYQTSQTDESIKYLCSFFQTNFHLFTDEDFQNFLTCKYTSLNIGRNKDLIFTIVDVFKKNTLTPISDDKLISGLLDQQNEFNEEFNLIVPLWVISNEEIKDELKSKIIDSLDNEFVSSLYVDAVSADIISFDKYFEDYIVEVKKLMGNGNYTLRSNGKPTLDRYVFYNAMLFVYNKSIGSDDKRFEIFTDLSPYMQFYLSPETFSYDLFKGEWLLISPITAFKYRFSKIEALKFALHKELQANYNEQLSKVYFDLFRD